MQGPHPVFGSQAELDGGPAVEQSCRLCCAPWRGRATSWSLRCPGSLFSLPDMHGKRLCRAAGLARCPRGLSDGLHSHQGSLATFLVGRDQQLPQQLGGASNLLLCLGTAIEPCPLTGDPNQAKLPVKLSGQTGSLTGLYGGAEPLAGVSARAPLQAVTWPAKI